MNLAVSNIAWDAAEDDEVARLFGGFGVKGLEVAPTKVWPAPADVPQETSREYRRRWEDKGIRIVAMQALLFGRPDLALFGGVEACESMIAYLAKIIRLGATLGAGALVFGSPKNRLAGHLSHQHAQEIAAGAFRRLGQIAADEGTCFCIEPNPPAYGCDFVTTAAQARAIVRAVDHPGFRCHLDLGIMAMNGEDPATELRASVPWMAHFHVSEPNLAAVGRASEPQQRAAAAELKEQHYDRWVSIEMRNGWTKPNTIAVSEALQAVTQNFR